MKLRKFLMLALVFAAALAQAQQMPKIPVDKAVRIGKLSNGLTYYIRHNNWPERVANFYIAQRVGSIQENDDQRGLAHFLEHMAFNGSEHFKDNNLIEYTRSLGVEFGSDLNAYTSIDQTVYRVCNVPTKRQSSLDSCMLILKDWSNGLDLQADEIDKERGVIHQEWQLRSTPGMRMMERDLPKFYPGSKYAYRMPIGLMSIVDNFKPKFLRDYYKKWYRPDNQAIIVVGDIDVDHTEKLIKELWKDVTVPANAAKVVDEPVPDNNQAIYVFDKDKEQPYSQVSIYMKHDVTPDSLKDNCMYLVDSYAKTLICMMLNSRLSDMTQKPDCPFMGASVGDGNYIISKTKDAFSFNAIAKEGKELDALATGFRELNRARQYGFNASEFDRAKANYMSSLDKMYNERDKVRNDSWGDQYRDHYLSNEPIPSVEDEYAIMKQIAPMVNVNMLNAYIKQLVSESDTNLVVSINAQEKAGKTYPSEAQMAETVKKARAEKVEPYVDNVKNEPLVPVLPKKGKIVSEKESKKFGYKELTLSNGARVLLKHTDFKKDAVSMIASAKGGKSLYGEKDFKNLNYMANAIGASGLGNFDSNELPKTLAGKQCGVQFGAGLYSQSVSGSSTPKDLETMMQLLYLYFTNIKKDTTSYNTMIASLKMQLKNKDLSPESVFGDSVNVTMCGHSQRFAPSSINDLDKISYDRMLEIGREMLSNAGAFTFTFIGNFDEAKLRPLIEQYIASLPGDRKKAKNYKQIDMYVKGEVQNNFSRKMETPKCIGLEMWTANMPYSLENAVLASVAGDVLSMEYLKQIREDASAASSVSASGSLSRNGKKVMASLQSYCPMDPNKREQAVGLLKSIVKDCTVKVDPDKVAKIKANMLKSADMAVKTNGYWMNIIREYDEYGVDAHTDYKKVVEGVTPAKIAAYLKKLLSAGNHVEVVMTPEK